MILKTDWCDYVVHVKHDRDTEGNRVTTMRAHDGACQGRPCGLPTPLKGKATCAPQDAYVRIRGNKIAFARLISHFDRSARATLWGEFWKNHKRPR